MKAEKGKNRAMKSPAKPQSGQVKSVTDQYRDAAVEISTGYEPNLSKVPVPHYTDEEHGTWKLMFERQSAALPGRATLEYLEALKRLNLPSDRIPKLRDVSKVLEQSTGWKVARVAGLVPEKEFFECLSQKLFPCTDFIRSRNELEYTPSPDMFHDIFGHIPLVTHPEFAKFYEFFGKAALRANKDQLVKLQRIYWFSVEFGLIQKPEGIRIYGSGILSSVGEVTYCLGPKPRRHPYKFSHVENQHFEINHMQEDLFVIPSFEWLNAEFKAWAKQEKLV